MGILLAAASSVDDFPHCTIPIQHTSRLPNVVAVLLRVPANDNCRQLNIGPHAVSILSGPWGDNPWTCTARSGPVGMGIHGTSQRHPLAEERGAVPAGGLGGRE